MNTERFDKKGTHWWSFLNIHPAKEVILFDSFGFSGLNEFVIQGDKKIINTLLYDFKKFNKSDDKITIIAVKFSMLECKEIKKTSNALSNTMVDAFLALNEFGKNIIYWMINYRWLRKIHVECIKYTFT